MNLISDVEAVQRYLIQIYEGATQSVQVMPLEDDEGLPLDKIYGPVLIEQDLMANKKSNKPDEAYGQDQTATKHAGRPYEATSTKQLDSIRDLFYIEVTELEENNENKEVKVTRKILAKRIVLCGEAGHGKTVFCLKLIDTWSKSKTLGQSSNKKQYHRCGGKMVDFDCKNDDEKLQKCLSAFDLVFYVPLRHAKPGTSSIVDLVCDSVSECDKNDENMIKRMLCDSTVPCLVILDGLDEFKVPDTCRVRGFPDSDGLVNCTLLCTMRPWRMVDLQLRLDSKCDKVVQIRGLKSTSVEKVISYVLVNFYGLEITSQVYKQKFQHFCAMAKLKEIESLMKVPLMLTASCLVWNEEGDFSSNRHDVKSKSKFLSYFYLKLSEITVTRAENKHNIVSSFLCKKRENPNTSLSVPSILSEFEPIIDFLEILKPIGRLALQDLLSEEPHLVFPKNKLGRDIGQSTVEGKREVPRGVRNSKVRRQDKFRRDWSRH